MSEELDYTFDELLEQAMNDDSWEPDPQKRVELAMALKFSV